MKLASDEVRVIAIRWLRVGLMADIVNMRFHDLRHTYALLSLQSGCDIKTLSANLGHATVAFTLDRYGHVSKEMLEQNSERMQNLICQLTKPTVKESVNETSSE